MPPEDSLRNGERPRADQVEPNGSPHPRLTTVVLVVAISVIVLAILLPPATVLGKADLVGYAICHRIPERSYALAGRQLPLCARCTGTFLGVMLGLGAMLLYGRQRAAGPPPVPLLGILVLFVAFWAFDGLNSYLTLFPGAPHLYEPRNWLRLATGLLNGLALITFVFPIFNFSLWQEPSEERVFENAWELLALLPVAAVLVLLVETELGILLYPLAVLSALGVVVMLALLNAVIAALALGRESYATNWRQALIPITVGAGLSILEMTALILVRGYLTTNLGLTL